MIIDVTELPPEGARFEAEEPASIFDSSDALDEIRFQSPVLCSIQARLGGEELLVEGRLDVTVGFRCSRCGAPFSTGIREPNFFAHRDMKTESADQFVDLTEDIRESILLAFPSHPVCTPECKGLCPQCGANWNKETCGCRAPDDHRWSALDQLSP